MKHIYALTGLIIFSFSALAQTVLLNIDGEAPDPFDDKSGNHTVNTVGNPIANSGTVYFSTGDDYLIIDPFTAIDLQQDWSIEFKIQVNDPMDSVFPLDWRSNSSVGHMHVGYNGVRGIYFSDRTQNGIYGSLVADPTPLPAGIVVNVKVALEGDSMKIWRNGMQTASAYFNGVFSDISTTTIGYSEDFRYDHSGFMLDDLVVTANPTSSLQEHHGLIQTVYPNPAADEVFLRFSQQPLSIELTSIDGRSVRNLDPRSTIARLDGLPNGMYLLKVMSDKGIATQRLIKQ